jgi:hypothetical protein
LGERCFPFELIRGESFGTGWKHQLVLMWIFKYEVVLLTDTNMC